MSIDRTIAPITSRAKEITAALPEKLVLDNGVPVFQLRSEISEACRIDFVFSAGSFFQPSPLIARFTNLLMMEGTRKHPANELASLLEYYGAFVQAFSQKDFAGFSVSLLASQIPEVLPLIVEILTEPTLIEDELSLIRDREKKAFIDELRKVQTIAVREFNERVFGSEHPYGTKVNLDDFEAVNRSTLSTFHTDRYLNGEAVIFACGGLPTDFETTLNRLFGSFAWSNKKMHASPPEGSFPPPSKGFFEMPDKLQNAIRVGKTMIPITHPDYPAFKVLNTILGGYFGSRLMTNIREEKGYTYGIYSMNVSYKHAGLFLISTECGAENWEPALVEIYKEVDRLCNEEVGMEELELVKSFMMGSLQRALDCPFNTMDYLRTLYEAEMDPAAYLKTLTSTIQKIDGKEIMKIAEQYLTTASLTEFICGRK